MNELNSGALWRESTVGRLILKWSLILVINFIDITYCTRIAAGSKNYWGFSNLRKEMLVRNKNASMFNPCP